MDLLALLRKLTAIPAPPGQEGELASELSALVRELGHGRTIDSKGNLIVGICDAKPKIVVTAHMDEIAMIVRRVFPDGTLSVTNLGGMYPWKLGEGPVDILASFGSIPGILGFGSIHTNDPGSRAQNARVAPLDWP